MNEFRPVPKPAPRAPKPKRGVRKVNKERAAKREARDFGPFAAWIRQQPCCAQALGHVGKVEAAHVLSRGAGGRSEENLLPLCEVHHRMQHEKGWEYMEGKYFHRSRHALAGQYWKDYVALGDGHTV